MKKKPVQVGGDWGDRLGDGAVLAMPDGYLMFWDGLEGWSEDTCQQMYRNNAVSAALVWPVEEWDMWMEKEQVERFVGHERSLVTEADRATATEALLAYYGYENLGARYKEYSVRAFLGLLKTVSGRQFSWPEEYK